MPHLPLILANPRSSDQKDKSPRLSSPSQVRTFTHTEIPMFSFLRAASMSATDFPRSSETAVRSAETVESCAKEENTLCARVGWSGMQFSIRQNEIHRRPTE